MRNFISHLLILSLLFGNVSASARIRKTPPKASTKLLQWITPDWIDINFGKNSEGDPKKQVKDLNSLMANSNSRGSSANLGKGKGGGAGGGFGAGSGQT